ncbi:hypothetical protein ACLOJK_022135, partial [Asimina triloba]
AGRAFMNKGVNEAFQLLEDMTTNNYQWNTDKQPLRHIVGIHERDASSPLKMFGMWGNTIVLNKTTRTRALTILVGGTILTSREAIIGTFNKIQGPPFRLDLNVIREGYSIPSSIVLSAPAAHKTPRDNRPGYLCLNEYILGAGVRIPFAFGVAEALWAFNVPPACILPHSWKYCEHRGCSADWYLWRELLTRWLSQGHVEFLVRRDVKGIDNLSDCLSSKGDIWGIPERWEEPLPDPILRSRLSLPASQRWALMYFQGTTLHWHPSREEFFRWCESAHFAVVEEGKRRAKRARSSGEKSHLVDSDSSVEGAPGSSLSRQPTPAVDLEGVALPSVVAQLREELESSHAEVARLQSMLRRDVVLPSTMAEYLGSDAYRRQEELEQAHHSWRGYIRALSDVAALYPKMDLSSLYRSL